MIRALIAVGVYGWCSIAFGQKPGNSNQDTVFVTVERSDKHDQVTEYAAPRFIELQAANGRPRGTSARNDTLWLVIKDSMDHMLPTVTMVKRFKRPPKIYGFNAARKVRVVDTEPKKMRMGTIYRCPLWYEIKGVSYYEKLGFDLHPGVYRAELWGNEGASKQDDLLKVVTLIVTLKS